LAYILINGSIVCELEMEELTKAIVAYISMFYVINIDYPKEFEIPLTILQFIVIGNNETPLDILKSVQGAWSTY